MTYEPFQLKEVNAFGKETTRTVAKELQLSDSTWTGTFVDIMTKKPISVETTKSSFSSTMDKDEAATMVLVNQTETTDMSRKDLDGKPVKTYDDPTYTVVDESETITPTQLLTATRSAFDLQDFFQNNVKPDGQRIIIRRLRELTDENGRPAPYLLETLIALKNIKQLQTLCLRLLLVQKLIQKLEN